MAPRFVLPQAVVSIISLKVSPFFVLLLPQHISSVLLYSAYRIPSIDKLGLSLSILGIYGLILCLRYLIPYYAIPHLSARLKETRQLLDHAEAVNAIPPECEYRTSLDLYEDISLRS